MSRLVFVDRKVIVSGGMVEEWIYEMASVRGLCPKARSGHSSESQKRKWGTKNKKESFNHFLRLVCTNFLKTKSRFITLTFKENVTDVAQANKEFENFIKRLRRKYGSDFKYLSSIEFQERGAVHYHIISDICYVEEEEMEKIWGHGFVKIKFIETAKHCAVYAGKYMRKGIADDRLKGKKGYWTSKNLVKPVEFLNQKADDLLKSHPKIELYTEKSYQSEHNGQVRYRKFFINS